MTKPMAFPIRFWAVLLICLLTYQFSTNVYADNCKYDKDIDLTLDLSSSELLDIAAGAGSLEINGVSGANGASIHGKVCVSKEEWLEASDISTSTGKRARIAVDLPQNNSGWSFMGNSYAYMDLVIEVPDDMALDVKDSSGGMWLKNVGPVEIDDSSGEIEVSDAHGAVAINDSSGAIELYSVAGDVTITDSSGDVTGRDINGSVLVERDSSGDLRFTQVGRDVIVEKDSSGDIRVSDVGGDFRVLRDGSGDVIANNVEGEVDVPE